MNGLIARRKASEFSKKSKELVLVKDLDSIFELIADVQELKDLIEPLREAALDEWFETENEKFFDEAWRYDKAQNALSRIETRLEEFFWEQTEIRENRIARKKEEKLAKGWL